MNIVTLLNNSIKEEPADAPYFKGIVMLPIGGLVVQLWKTFSLLNERQTLRDNKSGVFKIEEKRGEIRNFSRQSYKLGGITDISLISVGILGLGMSAITPFVATSLIGVGALSLFARKVIVVFTD